MKGMMAAELTELSACVPYPQSSYAFMFYFLNIRDKILYAEIEGSTSLKSERAGSTG